MTALSTSARRLRVGIVDSGCDADERDRLQVIAGQCFVDSDAGDIAMAPLQADRLGHGTDLTRLIVAGYPAIDLLVAQVFVARRDCSTAVAAAAIDWLVSCEAAVINLSFGVRHPDARLRLACERAVAAGCILVSSSPARGAPSFPAAYPCCIAVCGDARCSAQQISWLGTRSADFGAHAPAPGNPANGGASYAAARVSAQVARLLGHGTPASAIRERLRAQCRYHGPERRQYRAAHNDGAPAPHAQRP